MEGPQLHLEPRASVSDSDVDGTDRFNPCVTDTFLDVPSAEIVVVPWKVFQMFPDILHANFRTIQGQITYDDDINIFMTDPNLQPSVFGYMEEFTQTWVVKLQTDEELTMLIKRLTSQPSLLSVILTAHNIVDHNIEIPMVLFLSPESTCIRDLVTKLGRGREYLRAGKKFSVELDMGPSMQCWGKQVLRREFLAIGGRICFTSGSIFNHVFDWTNILGCLPCLPCGLVGGSIYRLHRRINYKDDVVSDLAGIVTLGAKGVAYSSQRHAVYLLMQWIKVFKMYYCIDCRRRVPVDDSQKAKDGFCRCDDRPATASTLSKHNKVFPVTTECDQDPSLIETEERGESRQTDTSPGRKDDDQKQTVAPYKDSGGFRESETSGREDKTRIEGSGGDEKVTKEEKSSEKRSKNSKAKRSRRDEINEDPGKFNPYGQKVAGEAIDRKKWMVTNNPGVTTPEWQQSMHVLNTKKPGGMIQRKTLFKYPKKQRSKPPSKRPVSTSFVEVELQRADNYEVDVSEDTSAGGLKEAPRRIYLDDCDEGFYFLEEGSKGTVDVDPLGQVDLKRFLVHISDPNTGTLKSAGHTVTTQPESNTESSV